MTDVLVRDVPEEVVAALDAHAARLVPWPYTFAPQVWAKSTS